MSDPTTPAAGMIAGLERFQRRLWLVAFVKSLPLSVTVATAGALAVARSAGLQPTVTAIAVLFGVLAAALAAAVIARRHTGLARTAAAVDRRFGLANRMTTALECAGQDDGMSSLVVADAGAVLSLRRPQDVSFETPRHLTWIVTGFAASVAAFFLLGGSSNAREQLSASEGVLRGGAAASPTGENRTTMSPATAASANSTARRSVPAAATDQGERVESRQAARRDEAADRVPGARDAASTASERAGALQQSSATDGSQSMRANAANSASQGARAASANANGSEPRQPQAGRGGAGASTEVRTTTDAAGGVRGASPPDRRATGDTLRPRTSVPALTPVARWDRAESALAREQLPLEMRNYVRDYLIAIRTGTRP